MTNARQITVEQALLEAEKATKAAKYSDAITIYEAILKYQPDNIVAKTALDALYPVSYTLLTLPTSDLV